MTSNVERGQVVLLHKDSGNEVARLQFTMNAICELEEELDVGVAGIQQMMSAGDIRMGLLRSLVRCSLNWDDARERHTDEEAGAVIDKAGVKQAAAGMLKAFQLYFPEAAKVAAGVEGDADQPENFPGGETAPLPEHDMTKGPPPKGRKGGGQQPA